MVLSLITDVFHHLAELRMSIGKSPEAFMLIEFSADPLLLVDESGRIRFDVTYKVR